MNSRKLTVLTIIAGVLALGEFGSAVMIWLEHTGPAAGALLAALFGLFLFLLGAWLLPSGRVTAGTIFVGLLCLVEVAAAPPRWGPARRSRRPVSMACKTTCHASSTSCRPPTAPRPPCEPGASHHHRTEICAPYTPAHPRRLARATSREQPRQAHSAGVTCQPERSSRRAVARKLVTGRAKP
jgi:hypothetical protein